MTAAATNPPHPRAPFDRAKPYGPGNGIECADNAGFILGVTPQAQVDAETQRENDAHWQAICEWRQQHGPNGPLDDTAIAHRTAEILQLQTK